MLLIIEHAQHVVVAELSCRLRLHTQHAETLENDDWASYERFRRSFAMQSDLTVLLDGAFSMRFAYIGTFGEM